MVLFVALIQVCMVWIEYMWGFFGAVPAIAHVLRPLTIAWYAGIAFLTVAVVQQDAMAAVDQDWLIRPVRRWHLLLAKIVFVVLTVSVPMFVLDLTRALAAGFPLGASLGAVSYKESYVIVCLVVPMIALASTATRMSELVAFGAALVATYAVSVGLAAAVLGANSCPTCDSGIGWLQHLFAHMGVLVGAMAIIALQYLRRATHTSRALFVLGVVALVFVQLPWSAAWALQRWLLPASNEARGVSIVPPERSYRAMWAPPGAMFRGERSDTRCSDGWSCRCGSAGCLRESCFISTEPRCLGSITRGGAFIVAPTATSWR
jgi:hypothetical protein